MNHYLSLPKRDFQLLYKAFNGMIALFFLTILFCCLLFYIKLATRYNIIDNPNERSSHKYITIRGGGIIFPLAILLYTIYTGFQYPYFITGLIFISGISFWDDLSVVSNKIRLTIHLIAVSLLFFQLDIFHFPFLLILIAFILNIGIINAYNFMDGINGITVLYSLSVIGSLYFINQFIIPFIDSEYFIAIILALLVFGVFNIRKKAIIFAGDVGSVSLAFIVSFLLIKLMIQTQSLLWILFLSIYGIETIGTILFRLIRKESIFKAHRSHFYQYLANDMKYNHVIISLVYASMQIILNILIIYLFTQNKMLLALFCTFMIVITYLIIRFRLEGTPKLLIKY